MKLFLDSAKTDEIAQREGSLMCPEGAATYAAYKQCIAASRVSRAETACYSTALRLQRTTKRNIQ